MRPGKYRICAVEIFRFAGGGGQDFMRKLFDRAEEIEIKEGDRLSKDLRMLPAEEADAKPKP